MNRFRTATHLTFEYGDGVTDLVDPREHPKDAFYQKKWKKTAKAAIKNGKNAVEKVLKDIGRNVSEFVSKGAKVVNDFFKNPLNIKEKSSTSSPTKKKDSRTFIEKLFNIKEGKSDVSRKSRR